MILVRTNDNRGKGGSNEVSRHNNKFIQIVRFDMKHITFIQILKPPGNAIGKMQMSEGRGVSRLMQCYWMREGGMLLSYRPRTTNESEANAAGKLDTRSESRKRAFDHHDTLDT